MANSHPPFGPRPVARPGGGLLLLVNRHIRPKLTYVTSLPKQNTWVGISPSFSNTRGSNRAVSARPSLETAASFSSCARTIARTWTTLGKDIALPKVTQHAIIPSPHPDGERRRPRSAKPIKEEAHACEIHHKLVKLSL